MNYVILHILCEGQTEERFVKEILAPYLQQFNIYPKPILLLTSKKKNARGGMLSYAQARRDMEICIRQHQDKGCERHMFTTMFDFYALPEDFPGFAETAGEQDVRHRISLLEQVFAKQFPTDRLIPYLQLHEFEALLFTDISKLSVDYPDAQEQIVQLKAETDSYDDPEMINNHPDTAPSKRIIHALDDRYNYNKVKSGTAVASAIGLDAILAKCLHFRQWIDSIKSLAEKLI